MREFDLVLVGVMIIFLKLGIWMLVAMFTKSWANHLAAILVYSIAVTAWNYGSLMDTAQRLQIAPKPMHIEFAQVLFWNLLIGSAAFWLNRRQMKKREQ